MLRLPVMQSSFKLFAACVFMFGLSAGASAQVNITTWQVDNQHTGNNAQETILTPGNVGSPGNFGLQSWGQTDGQTFGQPLFVSAVTLGDGSVHDMVYVGTQHASVFAFAADGTGSVAYKWQRALLPDSTYYAVKQGNGTGLISSTDIQVEYGMTTTPVIDLSTKTLYAVSKLTKQSDLSCHQFLWALDLATGAPKFGSPVEIAVNFPGDSTENGQMEGTVAGQVPFNPLHEHLRCAMTLYNGVVYLAFASHSDWTPYHGEIIGYKAADLSLAKTFIATPHGGSPKGGFWASGAGPSVDANGNLYIPSGNGNWDQTTATTYGADWGESVLKMSTTGALGVNYADTKSWFTPSAWNTLNGGDLDIGSGGLTLLPEHLEWPRPHLMVGGGKGGTLYVVDRDNLGGLTDHAVQGINEPLKSDGSASRGIFATPAYYNGCIYYAPSGEQLEQRKVAYNSVDGSYISDPPILSQAPYAYDNRSCFISSNGTTNGVAWIIDGRLDAFDAANIGTAPIYTSNNLSIPSGPSVTTNHFTIPIAANGRVFFTAYQQSTNYGYVLMYGLVPTPAGAPTAASNATAAPLTANSIVVGWTDTSGGTASFRIKRAASFTGTYSQVATVGPGLTTYTDPALTASTTYYYQVTAYNTKGDANASNVATATTFPTYAENGLVAYWPLDETVGTSAGDATGNGHTGTLAQEAYFGSGTFINGVAEFHGTGQAPSNIAVANKSDLQFSASQSFTLAAWANPSAVDGTEKTIIAKSRDQGNYYGIWINASNQWVGRGPNGDLAGGAAVGSTWTHVALVQDGAAGTRKLYVNGVQSGPTGTAQPADGAGALWMASQNVTGSIEAMQGGLDEVRLYNRALAAGEITHLMGPPVLEAQSNQTHPASGTFGVIIWPALTRHIEPRKGATAGQYSVVLNFSAPVSGIAPSLRTQNGNPAVGSVSSVNYDIIGRVVTVALTGVGNAQALDLHLSNISPGNGTADIPFNVLWGDVNQDGIVNALDAAIVSNSPSSVITGATAVYDINVDGAINASDTTLASGAAGTSLGAQTETNLAIFQPAKASTTNGGNIPSNAVDANATNTSWESVQGTMANPNLPDPSWIYVDLGATSEIHRVILNWENAAAMTLKIQVASDGSDPMMESSWSAASAATAQITGGTPGLHTYPITPYANARYVRMLGETRTTQYGYNLYDFEVIGLSSIGSGLAPAINSGSAAAGTVGNAFGYQITATNGPASYTATGLPPGLGLNASTGLISGMPTQSGTSTATIKATNANGTGSAPLTISVQAPYAAWQNLWFLTGEQSNAAVSGVTAIPAGDGITNLLKYALNLNPKANGTGGLPVQSTVAMGGQNYLTLTYTRALRAADLVYTVEVSSDLTTWTSGSGYTTTTTVNNADGVTQRVVVRDLTPMSSNAERFMRLRVSQAGNSTNILRKK